MDLISGYIALSMKADLLFGTTEQFYDRLPKCHAGCCHCCTLSSVLPIEAFALAHAIHTLDAKARATINHQANQHAAPFCPMLIDDLCSVYPSRPIICRTHGAPVAYLDYLTQTVEISACPEKFPADFSFDPEKLLFMDEVNSELQELNRQFLALHPVGPPRLTMNDIVLRFKGLCAPTAEPDKS